MKSNGSRPKSACGCNFAFGEASKTRDQQIIALRAQCLSMGEVGRRLKITGEAVRQRVLRIEGGCRHPSNNTKARRPTAAERGRASPEAAVILEDALSPHYLGALATQYRPGDVVCIFQLPLRD